MRGIIAAIPQWLRKIPSRGSASPLVELTCPCGRSAHVRRQGRRRFFPCQQCGRKVFVLPLSPLPAVAPPAAKATSLSLRASLPRGKRGPMAVVSAVLLVAGIVLFFIWRGVSTKR